MTDWLRHWGLGHDPFRAHSPPFVATESALQALGRFVEALDSAVPRIRLIGEPGVGKTTVLARALAISRRPGRRMVVLSGSRGGTELPVSLAGRLVPGLSAGARLADPWARLERAIATARLAHARIVVAIDDASGPCDEQACSWIDRLIHLSARAGLELSVVEATSRDHDPFSEGRAGEGCLVARVMPLTRDEAEHFLTAKLAAAGCEGAILTPRAITRLHGLALGLPGRIESLATASLRAAAGAKLEITTPEIVDAAAFVPTIG